MTTNTISCDQHMTMVTSSRAQCLRQMSKVRPAPAVSTQADCRLALWLLLLRQEDHVGISGPWHSAIGIRPLLLLQQRQQRLVAVLGLTGS
jgi:hypothetical protein